MASELQTRINADANLSAASKSVTVSYSANSGRFTITSDTVGNTSSVAFNSVPAATESVFGFLAGQSYDGTVAQTVLSDATGLAIRADAANPGASGTITFTQGVMALFESVLEGINRTDGSIDSRLGSLDARIADLDEEAARFDARMTEFEARLRTQFASADALISQLNTTSDFLLQQISLLPLTNLNKN